MGIAANLSVMDVMRSREPRCVYGLVLKAATVLCLASVVFAQSPDENARADRIERSVLPSVRVRGRSYAPTSIAARLAETHTPALSIAVIHDGRLAWARAYGVADAATGGP
jgi:CubicO group peptidase (beta-lactamase class C family)